MIHELYDKYMHAYIGPEGAVAVEGLEASGSNRELALLGFSTYALAMIPTLLAIHLLRQSFKAKHQLLEQFENFAPRPKTSHPWRFQLSKDLSKAECTEEADRLFIHRAIELLGRLRMPCRFLGM